MEIALVILVLGLLVGTMAAAQDMLATTRAKVLARELAAVRTAIDAYHDRFHALPGDDPRAPQHVTGATVAPGAGNGAIDGAWNSANATDESMLVWQHLRLAGLLPLPHDADTLDPRPRHIADGRVGVGAATPGQRQVAGLGGSLQVCAGSVPGKLGKLVDRLIDDGDTATGYVRLVPQGAPPESPATATAAVDDGASYVLCQSH